MKAGFIMRELAKESPSPFTIKFDGNNNCPSINSSNPASYVGKTSQGRVWLASNYTDCGVQAKHYGNDSIVFEHKINVEYGTKADPQNRVYRSKISSHTVKCFFDRKVNHELHMNVTDQAMESQTISK